ncbi:receptor-like protein 43 [Camellia sinensis]|uniref:receptor-like protein 43 n=1 Tax=Camellia sinensis TaxID=4442 RepID=UPI0010363CD1|nr:receptor-like protein 43 [Camellia sinensis]
MDKAKLSIDTTPKQLVGLVFPGGTMPTLTFLDKELPPEGLAHNKPLHISVEGREKWVPVVLVDTGSAINVCPSRTTYAINLKQADFMPTAQVIWAYYNTSREEWLLCSGNSSIHPPPEVTTPVLEIVHGEEDVFLSGFTLTEARVVQNILAANESMLCIAPTFAYKAFGLSPGNTQQALQPLFLNLRAKMITCLHAQLCTQQQTSALLQFKQQFSFNNDASYGYCDSVGILSYPKMESWKEGSDCCSWDGVECDNNTNQVIGLDLSCSWLNGTIQPNSTIFYYFPHLQSLNLAFNYFEFINSSSPLQYLDLSHINFSGELPDSIGNLKSLKTLVAVDCKFYGSIPTSLGNLTEMTHLGIGYNNFTGMLPSSLSNLGNLVYLGVHCNNFEGKIADFLPNVKSLLYLHVDSNSFSGPFPSLGANLTKLFQLGLSNNQLRGPLPSQIIELPNLVWLNLRDNLISGTIPSWVFSLPTLGYFNLSNNKLTGHVKEFKSSHLIVVDLSNNNLHGRFPISTFKLANLDSLILSSNNFSGELDMLCHAISLQILVLSSNSFNGSIPQCLGNFSKYFFVLDLRKNNFSGTIPDTFAKENSFETINLDSNGFEGPVPKSLENCKWLLVLDLGHNMFSDKFPYWLENLTSLQVLILRSNKFHGPIPNSKFNFPFPNLRVMDLSNNYFTGPLPRKYFKNLNAMMNVDEASFELQYIGMSGYSLYYYNDCLTIVIKGSTTEMVKVLTIFIAIDFSKNNFEGQIPQIIGKLNSIQGLNLSHNSLTGHIPASLANLTMLEWLDLSSNKLTGKIPQQLRNLKFLEVLNLSRNQLVGPIPQGNQFDTFLNGSYIDNLALCGPPLLNVCNPRTPQPPPLMFQQEDNTSSGFTWEVILPGYICGMVWGLVMGYFIFSRGKPKWLVRIIEGERNKSGKRFKKHSHRNRAR